MTIEELREIVEKEKVKQRRIHENVCRGGGIYDPICKKWIPKPK